jgi:hypothetical protein
MRLISIAGVPERAPVVSRRDLHSGCSGGLQRQVGLLEVVVGELDEQRRPGRRGRLSGRSGARLRLLAETDLVLEAGDTVEAGQGGHQHLAVVRHPLEQVRALVQVHAVLDRVDALLDRDLGAVDPFGVGGDAVALAMGFLDQRRGLGATELRRVWVLEQRAEAGGRRVWRSRFVQGPERAAGSTMPCS